MIRGEISSAQSTGPYKRQEDRFVHFPFKNERGDVFGHVLAVMDGHTTGSMFGETVPEICEKRIPELFNLEQANHAKRALSTMIERLDKDAWLDFHGSTISVAIILESHHYVSCATLGDSPLSVILQDSTHTMPIHNVVTNMEERQRAIDSGGTYEGGWIWNYDTPSPDIEPRGLEISRGLGDKVMGNVISTEPSFFECRLEPSSAVLITTDGVRDSRNTRTTKEIDELLFREIRAGADAQTLMDERIKHTLLKDHATILLWSTFERLT